MTNAPDKPRLVYGYVPALSTERQLELLREAGCDCFQGHLPGRPAPAAEIEGMILACV